VTCTNSFNSKGDVAGGFRCNAGFTATTGIPTMCLGMDTAVGCRAAPRRVAQLREVVPMI
jgi:hypothetical protein